MQQLRCVAADFRYLVTQGSHPFIMRRGGNLSETLPPSYALANLAFLGHGSPTMEKCRYPKSSVSEIWWITDAKNYGRFKNSVTVVMVVTDVTVIKTLCSWELEFQFDLCADCPRHTLFLNRISRSKLSLSPPPLLFSLSFSLPCDGRALISKTITPPSIWRGLLQRRLKQTLQQFLILCLF